MLPISFDDDMEIIEVHARAGGYSSVHLHKHKYNHFLVKSGLVRVSEIYGEFSKTVRTLHPGGSMTILAGVRHKFDALKDSVIVELYGRDGTQGKVDPCDIVRFSENGVHHASQDQKNAS